MSHLVGSAGDFLNDFLYGAAKAFFVTAYADFCDSIKHSEDERESWGLTDDQVDDFAMADGGEDWADMAPVTPPAAYAVAGMMIADIARANPDTAGIYTLVQRAKEADGADPDPEDFGWCLAMQYMGHGVSWFDDHKHFECKIPHREVTMYDFSVDAYRGDSSGYGPFRGGK